jgi:Domain of unknown function (DUF4129)
LVLLAGVLVAVLPRQVDTSWLRFIATGQRDEEAARRFEEVLRRLFPCSTPGDPRCRTREVAPGQSSELFRLPEEISIILFSAVISGIIFGMGYLLIKSGIPLPVIGRLSLKNWWHDLIAWFKGLFAPKVKAEKLETGKKQSAFENFLGRFRRERIPSDLRGQVRYHYKHTLERATRAGYPRSSGTTPAEYAGEVAPDLQSPELETDLRDLTKLYNEARFSPHPLNPEQVETAASQTKRLTTFFRQLKRAK